MWQNTENSPISAGLHICLYKTKINSFHEEEEKFECPAKNGLFLVLWAHCAYIIQCLYQHSTWMVYSANNMFFTYFMYSHTYLLCSLLDMWLLFATFYPGNPDATLLQWD